MDETKQERTTEEGRPFLLSTSSLRGYFNGAVIPNVTPKA